MLIELFSFLPDSFEQIIPSIGPWIEGLGITPIAAFFQNVFAQIEVFHIIGLFMLGGATILTCLRLIGVGLVDVSPSEVEKNTRLFLNIGVIMAIVSGLMIGVSNASKLYNNSAFLFKMIAMFAGIIFTYAVMIPVAKADGVVSSRARTGLIIGMLIWLVSIMVMIGKIGSNVGSFHVILAGSLIAFMALQGKMRWIYASVLLLIVVAWQIVTHVVVTPGETTEAIAAFDMANKTFMWLSAIWVFGFATANILGKSAPKDSNALSRLIGYATILVWVTVGAGGRWIGLT